MPVKAWWLCAALSLYSALPAADPADGEDAAALEEIRSRIRDVESSIKSARDETDTLMKSLEQTEADANDAAGRLAAVETEIKGKSARLDELHGEQEQYRSSLADQQRQMGAQLRSAYSTGRHDLLKLLLNQEDPALIGRMLAYHGYFNRARARKIEDVRKAVLRVEELEHAIQLEAARLQDLRDAEQSRLQELAVYRESRNEIAAHLEQYISSQGRELEVLQRNEKELAALVEKLQREESLVERYEELPPFADLKGKLQLPVEGQITGRFGESRKGGRLKSHGITISATPGSEVHAVSAGKVVFADWFRNMGLLIILDHGGGFMSLYGHNESLLKKPGDQIDTGDIISRVGDTGGQAIPALYFEIRRDGDPLDPILWCRS